ncbi:MAG TPA: hypothetical protein PL028_05180, partial [Bacteroidales bacterium]|nr:hypothetical protein [Bacteroidales bacterium]
YSKYGLVISISAKANKFKLPINFYNQGGLYYSNEKRSFTKTINFNLNVSYKKILLNVGSILYCKDSIFGCVAYSNLPYSLHDFTYTNNKFAFAGYSIGIKYFLNKSPHFINPFIFSNFESLKYKFTDKKTFNVYPDYTISGSTSWQYKNRQIDISGGIDLIFIKNLNVFFNAGLSINSVIIYNSDRKISYLNDIEPSYITRKGFFFETSLLYRFIKK